MKSNEEKLSMTRELKFKELQEKIDEEESEKLVEEAILKSKKKASKKETSELEKEIDELLEVESKKVKKKKISKKEVEEELDELLGEKKSSKKKEKEDIKISKVNVDDDLYLTSSFKPLKKRFKLRKLFKFLFKLIFTILVLGAFVYFILLPVYKMINDSKPKAIFDGAIDYVQEKLDYVFTSSDNKNSFFFDTKLSVDSNMKDLNKFTDISFIFNGGVDIKNKVFDLGMYIEKNNEKYGYRLIEMEGNNYTNYSTSDNYYKGLVNTGDKTFLDRYLNNANKVKADDYKYYSKKITDTLKELIKEEDLTATREEIEIDGVSNTVVRNSFKLDKKRLEEFQKDMNKILLKDKKFIEIQANMSNTTVEEIEKQLNEVKEYDKDYTLTFNIYTIKGNKFAGFDIEENGFRNIYYYNINKKFEFHMNISSSKECRNGGECKDSDRNVIDFIGTKKDNITTIDLYYNSEDIGTLKFYELNDKKVEFDYSLLIGDTMYKGDVSILIDEKNQKLDLEVSVELEDEYLTLNIDFDYDINVAVGEFDKDKILNKDDKLLQDDLIEFSKVLNEKNVYGAYQMYQSIFSVVGNLLTKI